MTEPPPKGFEELTAEEAIAAELNRVQEDSYGAGAREISVTIGHDAVFVLLDIELAPSEQTLIDSGRGEAVKSVRDAFQLAIEPTFRAIVERATGRRVCAFASLNSIDPLFAVEVFRLVPQSASVE